MKLYPLLKNEVELPRYKEQIKQLVTDNTSNFSIETKLLCRLKELVEDDRPIDISVYINDSEIYNMLNALSKDEELYPDVLAMAISRYSNNSNIRSFLLNSVGALSEEQTEKVASCIEYYISYGKLLLQLENFSAVPYVADIARILTTSSSGNSRMNIKDSLVNYDNIYSHLKLDSLSLLRRWNDWSRFVSSIKIADVPSLSTRLVEDMKKSSELQISKHCLGLVEEYLESIDQETWKRSFSTDNYNFKLLY